MLTSIINLVQQSSSKAHMHRKVKQKSEYRSKFLYIYQTFIDCVSVQYTYFDMSTSQILPNVMKGSMIKLRFLSIIIS